MIMRVRRYQRAVSNELLQQLQDSRPPTSVRGSSVSREVVL